MAQARTRRRFTAEDKSEAVKRPEESGRSLQQVADELGVHANQLRGWRSEQRAASSAEALAKHKAEAAELAAHTYHDMPLPIGSATTQRLGVSDEDVARQFAPRKLMPVRFTPREVGA